MKTTGIVKTDKIPSTDKMLDINGAAELLSVSVGCIRTWRTKRVIPAYMVQGALRFSQDELLEWAKSKRA